MRAQHCIETHAAKYVVPFNYHLPMTPIRIYRKSQLYNLIVNACDQDFLEGSALDLETAPSRSQADIRCGGFEVLYLGASLQSPQRGIVVVHGASKKIANRGDNL